jgi:hypothetical protein
MFRPFKKYTSRDTVPLMLSKLLILIFPKDGFEFMIAVPDPYQSKMTESGPRPGCKLNIANEHERYKYVMMKKSKYLKICKCLLKLIWIYLTLKSLESVSFISKEIIRLVL